MVAMLNFSCDADGWWAVMWKFVIVTKMLCLFVCVEVYHHHHHHHHHDDDDVTFFGTVFWKKVTSTCNRTGSNQSDYIFISLSLNVFIGGTVDPWIILPQERARYEEQFRALQPVSGIVTGEQAKGFLLQSRLPPQILGHIWYSIPFLHAFVFSWRRIGLMLVSMYVMLSSLKTKPCDSFFRKFDLNIILLEETSLLYFVTLCHQ